MVGLQDVALDLDRLYTEAPRTGQRFAPLLHPGQKTVVAHRQRAGVEGVGIRRTREGVGILLPARSGKGHGGLRIIGQLVAGVVEFGIQPHRGVFGKDVLGQANAEPPPVFPYREVLRQLTDQLIEADVIPVFQVVEQSPLPESRTEGHGRAGLPVGADHQQRIVRIHPPDTLP